MKLAHEVWPYRTHIELREQLSQLAEAGQVRESSIGRDLEEAVAAVFPDQRATILRLQAESDAASRNLRLAAKQLAAAGGSTAKSYAMSPWKLMQFVDSMNFVPYEEGRHDGTPSDSD